MLEIWETPAYSVWLSGLRDSAAKDRIDIKFWRLCLENPCDVPPFKEGIFEFRIRYGPVYRIRQHPTGCALVTTTLLATYP